MFDMREFLLLASKAPTTPDFDTNYLVKSGRLDLVARFVANALCVSNSIRKDTIVHVSMNGKRDPPKLISFYGDKIVGIQPDEQTIARLIKDALSKKFNPGITATKQSFESFLKERTSIELFYLSKSGEDISSAKLSKDALFIIGDYAGLPDKTEIFLDRINARKISLGKTELLASQCVTIIHYELDKV
jgi:tRNA (pseudouridine54-N1)-methyltransferase